MLRYARLAAVLSASLLAGCHSHAGYGSDDPELTYGPGVVEFPDAAHAYAAYHYVPAGAFVTPGYVHDVEVILIEPSAGPTPAHGAGEAVPSHGTPAKYGRRVRRTPGQPLGIEFTD